jgi:uncharacterized protein involved in type VI secretion and phage assembly
MSVIDPFGNSERGSPRIDGVVTGVVTNNQDPNALGRVKVRFRWLADDYQTEWARIAAPGAGASSGLYFVPNVDDEVLLAFEHGDVRFPYVLGGLWSPNRQPPWEAGRRENRRRVLATPGGQVLIFDESDPQQIVIADPANETAVTMQEGSVTVEARNGSVTVEAHQGIKLTCAEGTIEIKGMKVEITGETGVDIKGGTINLG